MHKTFQFATFIITIFFLFCNTSKAASLSGKITNSDSVPIAYANIYVKNTTYGTVSNLKGEYFIDLKSGTYIIVYSSLGFQNIEKEIVIKASENLKFDIVLIETDVLIDDIEVIAKKVDRAKLIMKKVRYNRKTFVESISNYECFSYVKTSIEKETESQISDSLSNSKDFNSYLVNEKVNLVEYFAQTYFKKPDNFKENILAYHNYTDEKPEQTMSMSIDYGEDNIVPSNIIRENPYIFYKNSSSGNFNFYDNLLNFPALCEQPLVSPIAYNSNLYYKFEFIENFVENGIEINKIRVSPLNNSSALFYGNIFIEDSTWALVSVDLFINENALTLFSNFNIIQNYNKIEDNIYLPVRTDITYTIKDNSEKILGSSKIIYKDYLVNQKLDYVKFNNEIISYADDAFDKDSSYWTENRLITLKSNELEFIKKTDSIQQYYSSEEFLDNQDSTFNAIRWWSPLVYVGYQNHNSGIEFYLGGLIQQVIPFGVGGYRHRLPFNLNKRFENGMYLETNFQVDYGFQNKDFKGKVGVGLTYFPKKSVRTFIEIGDNYEIINNSASIQQSFSRSNYARCKSFNIKQRMEIFNGMYAELSYLYSNQSPINDIQLERWSDFLFNELNEPIEFETYIKSEVKLELKYIIGQKYIIRKNAKIILGSDYPELSFIYRKGIPGLFKSEVDFDYIEIGAKGIKQLARFGESRWQLKAGWFLNKKDLRVLEYKYFRGSDPYFFSDPVNSMQLLVPTLNTDNKFLQANYIHHFKGIFNKIPLIKFLKIEPAAGVEILSIPQQNFYHFEMYAGIERIFRIRKQLIRVGAYAVTSDNTLSKADFSFKFGISFFDSYKNKWGY